jgi:hypothetical protein
MMKNIQKGFVQIILAIIAAIVVIGGIYYFSHTNTIANQPKSISDKNSATSTDKVITYKEKTIKVTDVPAMLVQKDVVFELGNSGNFKNVIFSPHFSKVAFSVRNAAHDFGWVYDFSTSQFIPLAFQYGGGIEVVGWKNENEVTLRLTTPKPSTTEQTFNLNSLSEYPKIAK